MQTIIYFLIKNKYFLLFLVLEIIAISFTIQSHSYHRSKIINSSNTIVGGLYAQFNNIENYFYLKTYNNELIEENTRLKNIISQNNPKKKVLSFDRTQAIYQQKYKYIHAKVIKNSYTKVNNRLTIDRGRHDSIIPELGVISSKGIVGITTNVSSNYAIVMPIINEKTRINAKLLNDTHFGTITWNGTDYNTVQLEDLPRQTNIHVGDTIITGGRSTIFPEGILIGTVKHIDIQNNSYKTIDIHLFNDMSAIYHINIITNTDKKEINRLENE